MDRFLKTLLLTLLRGYKTALSPLLPPACRFVPTCSDYAAEAIERRGALRGSAMGAWRLFRCHPFSRGGYDPVRRNDAVTNSESGARCTGQSGAAVPTLTTRSNARI